MVSEGVDIPRLRVGVYATTTSTELFFRQAVGRLVRWTRGVPRQRAWLFIPDDPRLRTPAPASPSSGATRSAAGTSSRASSDEQERRRGDDEQLSLFAVISAVATEAADPTASSGDELDALDDGPDDEIELTLAPPPPLRAGRAGDGADDADAQRGESGAARRERQGRARARAPHRHDARAGERGAEPLSRVRKVSEATLDQLERRLAAADRWLAKT